MEFLTIRRAPLVLLALVLCVGACSSPRGGTAAVATAVVPRGLVLRDLDRATHDLDATLASGRAVALVWWQTWCESCKAEAPTLAAAARAHGERVVFLGVVPGKDDYVDDGEVRDVARALGLPYPSVRDRDLSLTEAFRVEGTPTVIVLEGQPAKVVWSGHSQPPDFGVYGRGAAAP